MKFENLQNAIQQGIERHLHTGVQMYASVNGQTVLNEGFGFAGPDAAMTESTVMLWRSAGKPITAAAICRAWQDGRIGLDQPLASCLAATVDRPVGAVTIRQLLTHTSGLPMLETGWPQLPWEQIIARICHAETLAPENAYQPQSTWFLLGAVLEAIDNHGRSVQAILHDGVLDPVGMENVWCGIPASDQIPERLPTLYTREGGKLVPNDYGQEPWLSQPSPGGNFRGPVSQLGRFYEMLLNDGVTGNGNQFLETSTVSELTSRHREGRVDQTFQHVVDFGLGLIVDSNGYGPATVPYGFGQHCGPGTFGHGGAQCAMGFCDPQHKLVVAWAANGFCGEGQHQRRNRAINEALYTDLGLDSSNS